MLTDEEKHKLVRDAGYAMDGGGWEWDQGDLEDLVGRVYRNALEDAAKACEGLSWEVRPDYPGAIRALKGEE